MFNSCWSAPLLRRKYMKYNLIWSIYPPFKGYICLGRKKSSFLVSLFPCSLPSLHSSILACFLPSFFPPVLSSFLPSILPSILSCLLPSISPSIQPSFFLGFITSSVPSFFPSVFLCLHFLLLRFYFCLIASLLTYFLSSFLLLPFDYPSSHFCFINCFNLSILVYIPPLLLFFFPS